MVNKLYRSIELPVTGIEAKMLPTDLQDRPYTDELVSGISGLVRVITNQGRFDISSWEYDFEAALDIRSRNEKSGLVNVDIEVIGFFEWHDRMNSGVNP
ncbi:hypothetical protein JYT75_01130 [Oceanicaulis sp. AH-315-P02]|nr:hypothetical protein [Robiginitomaculum sp.]MBN4047902.1 hypothetical protein [Oceanicaulis sp. AH-315-P02]